MSPVLWLHMIESPDMLKVLVVGAGAVGLGLASFLMQSGCRVSLLGREDTELEKNGLYRIGIFGEFHSDSFEIFHGPAQDEEFDFVLVCVKSFDTENAGRQLQEWLSNNSRIVLCQNGWGNAEIFSEYFQNIFIARVITGFIRPKKIELMLPFTRSQFIWVRFLVEIWNVLSLLPRLLKRVVFPVR